MQRLRLYARNRRFQELEVHVLDVERHVEPKVDGDGRLATPLVPALRHRMVPQGRQVQHFSGPHVRAHRRRAARSGRGAAKGEEAARVQIEPRHLARGFLRHR